MSVENDAMDNSVIFDFNQQFSHPRTKVRVPLPIAAEISPEAEISRKSIDDDRKLYL